MEGRAYYTALLNKYIDGTASPEEIAELKAGLSGEEDREEWGRLFHDILAGASPEEQYDSARWQSVIDKIVQGENLVYEESPETISPAHVRSFINRIWRYVAAAVVIISMSIFVWIQTHEEVPGLTQTNPVPVQNDVAPGGNKAMLTLADGRKIVLDSAGKGEIAKQGNTVINKISDGTVKYTAQSESSATEVQYNTMTTPRGGQYHLVLPDGTDVWLNAESSITYPATFGGESREVTITGEAYFEVRKKKGSPFRVSVRRSLNVGSTPATSTPPLTVEVLGTHFNINSYPEKSVIASTLLEGSVRLVAGKNESNVVRKSLKLKMGQQGQWNSKTGNLSIAANPDIQHVMAWKNGLFDFNNLSFSEAMDLLARWYDVEVIYESNKIPKKNLRGLIGRDLKLGQVLNALRTAGVRYRIEEKKLIVTS